MKDLWKNLKHQMKEILIKISQLSKYHEISIINFSNSAIIECRNKDPNTFNVNELTFQNGGTSFEFAFLKAFQLLKNQIIPQPNKNYKKEIVIFMSDGEDEFPKNEISLLKTCNFEFYSISLIENSQIMEQICKELGGKMHFAENLETYKKICFEILENRDIENKKI